MRSIAEKLTTADVYAALRLRYTQPEWALMFEVAASTGWAGRYADAIAMNMYPSRGLALHGHEVKISRSDWLRELKQPEKAEAISQYCDFWWVVALPDIVKDGELPLGWGLMELRGKSLKIVTKAPQRDTVPLDRNFMAAMLRRAHQVDEATVAKLVEAGLEERTSYLRGTHESELAMARSEQQAFHKSLKVIQEQTGMTFYELISGERMADMLKLAKALSKYGKLERLNAVRKDIREARSELDEVEAALSLAIDSLPIGGADV